MRILHYLLGLPPVRGGGMIKYVMDLMDGEAKQGHDVSLFVPGRFTHFHTNTRIIKKSWKKLVCYHILNPLPVSLGKGVKNIPLLWQEGNKNIYIRFLEEARPEIIHIHSFMGLHSSFLKAAQQLNIPIVYTTHDYYGICPKILLLRESRQCTVSDGSQCAYCMGESVSTEKLKWKQSTVFRILKSNPLIHWLEYSQRLNCLKIKSRLLLKNSKIKIENLENKKNSENFWQVQEYQKLQQHYKEMFQYVTAFHFNSMQSKKIYTQYLGDVSGEIIPISNQSIADRRVHRKYGKVLRIGFIGNGMYKGLDLLKDALKNLYAEDMRDIECHVYFNPKEKMPPYIISHSPYRDTDMDKVYNGIDVLALPSIWKETFGMVVLEALSYGVPVIISENVGAKELLAGNHMMGMVIEPTEKALREALAKIYRNRELLEQMNVAICNWNVKWDYDGHVQRIVNMYRKIKA